MIQLLTAPSLRLLNTDCSLSLIAPQSQDTSVMEDRQLDLLLFNVITLLMKLSRECDIVRSPRWTGTLNNIWGEQFGHRPQFIFSLVPFLHIVYYKKCQLKEDVRLSESGSCCWNVV